MSEWQRIQEIFLAAVDLPAAEQVLLLNELCGGDYRLHGEVVSLLQADGGSAETIDAAIQNVASAILETSIAPGERLGVYRLVREIGRGGMGSVYLAVRDDQEYARDVALKVVRRGMNTDRALQRFRTERQILANLDHPYIARLYDGGTTESGIPYFAMEYVEGQPIDLYCRAMKLTVKQRCELFLKVLEAVSYAHQRLVVHGDLKPANIFVTADGIPKLLDFGVAKLLDANDDKDPSEAAGTRVFTPGYASPEQVRGRAITILTDVYSLGAIFYELLSGVRAQPLDFGTPTRIEHAVCEETSLGLPSAVAPPDLGYVATMALRKDPSDRYQSAEQFASDINRALGGWPVMAKADTAAYRARRFFGRNAVKVGVASFIALALIAALLISLLQTHRARLERARADQQRILATQKTEEAQAAQRASVRQRILADEQRQIADDQRRLAVQERDNARKEKATADRRADDIVNLASDTLFAGQDAIASLPGSLPARQKLVATALGYLQSLEAETGDNPKMREALAEAYYKLALIQGNPHGPSLQAGEAAEKSLLKAESILQPAYSSRPNDAGLMLRQLEIRSTLADLASLEGRRDEAIAVYQALLPISQRLARVPNGGVICERQYPVMENFIALLLAPVDPARALQHASSGLEAARLIHAKYPSDLETQQGLGALGAMAASANKNLGNLDAAERDYQTSIEARESLLQQDPTNLVTQRNLMVAYGNYALLLDIPWSANLNRPADARIAAEKSVAIARRMSEADPSNATARRDYAISLGRRGMVDPDQDRLDASLDDLKKAESLLRPIREANPKSLDLANQLAEILEFKGRRLVATGNLSGAIDAFRTAQQLLDPFVAQPKIGLNPDYLRIENDLALAHAANGDIPQADDAAAKSLADATRYAAQSPSSPMRNGFLASAYVTQSQVQTKAGRPQQARAAALAAQDYWTRVANPGLLTTFRKEINATQDILGHF